MKGCDLDIYQLSQSVANMVLWEYGMELTGYDCSNLVIINEKQFRRKLIKELGGVPDDE